MRYVLITLLLIGLLMYGCVDKGHLLTMDNQTIEPNVTNQSVIENTSYLPTDNGDGRRDNTTEYGLSVNQTSNQTLNSTTYQNITNQTNLSISYPNHFEIDLNNTKMVGDNLSLLAPREYPSEFCYIYQNYSDCMVWVLINSSGRVMFTFSDNITVLNVTEYPVFTLSLINITENYTIDQPEIEVDETLVKIMMNELGLSREGAIRELIGPVEASEPLMIYNRTVYMLNYTDQYTLINYVYENNSLSFDSNRSGIYILWLRRMPLESISFNVTLNLSENRSLFLDPDISSCGTLSSPNTIYYLTNDVSTSNNCFTINADNITIDCQGHTIRGPSYTQRVAISSNGYHTVVVRNCTITNFATGFYLYNNDGYPYAPNILENSNLTLIRTPVYDYSSDHLIIRKNSIEVMPYANGIDLRYMSNLTIENNTIYYTRNTYNSQGMIYLYKVRDYVIRGNTAHSRQKRNFIVGYYLTDGMIEDNNMTDVFYGIQLYSSINNLTVRNNSFSDSFNYALFLNGGQDIHFINNFVARLRYMLNFNNVKNLEIINNTFDNVRYFTYLSTVMNLSVINNSYSGIYRDVLYAFNVRNGTISDNTFFNLTNTAGRISGYNISVMRNNITYAGGGFKLTGSNFTVINNSVSYSKMGVTFSSVNFFSFIGNRIEQCHGGSLTDGHGLYLYYSSFGVIHDNLFENNTPYDVFMYAPNNNTCTHQFYNNVGTGNKSILFFNYHNDSYVLDGGEYSEIILCHANNLTVKNTKVIGYDNNGIVSYYSTDNKIMGNVLNNTYAGIYIYYDNRTSIFNNTISNSQLYSIYLTNSPFSNVSNNVLTDNHYGLYVDRSSYSTFNENYVRGMDSVGMFLRYSNNVSVYKNTIGLTASYPLQLLSSNNNTIDENVLCFTTGSAGILLDTNSHNNTGINYCDNVQDNDANNVSCGYSCDQVVEVCDNGLDDDFNNLTDNEDPACQVSGGGGDDRDRFAYAINESCARPGPIVISVYNRDHRYRPVDDVKVYLDDRLMGKTNESGLLVFDGEPGEHVLRLKRSGFKSLEDEVEFEDCCECASDDDCGFFQYCDGCYCQGQSSEEPDENEEPEHKILECSGPSECGDDETCIDYRCVPVECVCGEVHDHMCYEYECCSDSDCGTGFTCVDHKCVKKVVITNKEENLTVNLTTKPTRGKGGLFGSFLLMRDTGVNLLLLLLLILLFYLLYRFGYSKMIIGYRKRKKGYKVLVVKRFLGRHIGIEEIDLSRDEFSKIKSQLVRVRRPVIDDHDVKRKKYIWVRPIPYW